MQKVVVIVAGGSGTRMNSELPKQFIEINGLPILMHTIGKFHSYDPTIEIRLVLPASQIDFWNEMLPHYHFDIPCKVYEGGSTRFESVKNGLSDINDASLVAIHDGVRPFASIETIERGFQLAAEKGTAIPVISVHETLRHLSNEHSTTVNREDFKLVQTPQVFNSVILLEAYQQAYSPKFTDDASVVESLGVNIHLYNGNRENIKITTQVDLLIAKAYIGVAN